MPAVAWAVNRGVNSLTAKIQSQVKAKTSEKNDFCENGSKEVGEEAGNVGAAQGKRNSAIERTREIVVYAVSAALGVCANTALVLGMIWLLYKGETVGDSAITPEFMAGLVSLNFVIEVIVMTIATPPIAYAIRKQQEKNR